MFINIRHYPNFYDDCRCSDYMTQQTIILKMEVKSIPSFFEISINTEKFSQFASAISVTLANHEKLMQLHSKDIANLRLSIEDKATRLRGQFQYQLEKSIRKSKEESQAALSFHRDLIIKQEHFASQYRDKIKQLDWTIESINEKINTINSDSNDIILKRMEAEVQKIMGDSKAVIDKEVEQITKKINDLEHSIKHSNASNDFLMKNIIQTHENQKETKKDNQSHGNVIMTPTPHKKNNQIPVSTQPQQHHDLPIELMTIAEGKQRRRRQRQRGNQQNLQYASVSAKIEALENRLTAKQNESLDKVVWVSKKLEKMPSQSSQKSLEMSTDMIEVERKSLEINITTKLEHIEQIIELNFTKIEKELARLNYSNQLLTDQVEISSRKLEKEKTRFAELSLQLKRIEEKRLDEKMIDNMMTLMRRQYQNLEEEVGKKVNLDIFTKEKQRLGERIQVLGQSLAQKPEKEEIKRAFQFVEDKIKEIVLIIADDIQQSKQGAIKRVPFKCLSCNKDLQSSEPSTCRPPSQIKPMSRSGTSQMRRKIRNLNSSDEKL